MSVPGDYLLGADQVTETDIRLMLAFVTGHAVNALMYRADTAEELNLLRLSVDVYSYWRKFNESND